MASGVKAEGPVRPASGIDLHADLQADLHADLHAWALEQAAHLRAGRWDRLDALHLAEAVEGLAAVQRLRLAEGLQEILRHLLMWDADPEGRRQAWTAAIWNGRLDVEAVLRESPSLRGSLGELLAQAHGRARIEAADAMGVIDDRVPLACPYDVEAVMTRPISWPGLSWPATRTE
ncbi:DUF29 domain-containing protein [Methylobacterium symbioticum]|uniref:DUF29 domain-containing protein n=1 Tax=Methylobacterium symbioticum TaxID=2584084 RepID=A0A509EBI3_9HYPH|nr:DUF29 domain-containing protein [Methylobacterium symbioticum]VUD71561.1 hypothetical protein MET9862_02144 [Methylobacterium symbioticum]